MCQGSGLPDHCFLSRRSAESFLLRLTRCRCLFPRHEGKHQNPMFHMVLRNVLRHHCLHCSRDLHMNVWNYPSLVMLFLSATRILSHEDLIHSPCGGVIHQEILAEHVVDIHKVVTDFRDVFERIQSSSSQASGVNKYFSSQSPKWKRLRNYNWNPGPRRGKEDAIRM